MTEAVVAQKAPYVENLSPKKYFWCACGRSKNQPYCDGSHAGTGIQPVKVEIAEARLPARSDREIETVCRPGKRFKQFKGFKQFKRSRVKPAAPTLACAVRSTPSKRILTEVKLIPKLS